LLFTKKMKVLTGTKIKQLPFQLIKIDNIYEYDGPVLSHFKTDKQDDYFMFWVDNNIEFNRWLLVFVSKDDLTRYFYESITFKDLVLLNQKDLVYFIDIDSNVEYKNITLIAIKDIPTEYLPGDKSYFNPVIANKTIAN